MATAAAMREAFDREFIGPFAPLQIAVERKLSDGAVIRADRPALRAALKAADHNKVAGSVILTAASSIAPEAVKWLWPGYLAAGKFHILAGPPGVAKTTLAGAICSAFPVGGVLPDGSRAPLGDFVVWTGEDDLADTLIPRLLVAGADLNRVHFVQGARDENGKLRPFDPSCDMPVLAEALRGRNVKILILDPVVSAVAGDDHKNSGTRRALQPVVDLAAEVGCAVIGISHFSKGTQGRDVVERVTGSLAYGAIARIVLAVAKTTPEDAIDGFDRMLVRAKSNIGPDGGGFRFRVEQVPVPGHSGMFASAIHWGPAIEGHARDILAAVEVTGDPEEHSATAEAADWLRDLLDPGPLKAGDVQKQARAAGINEKPLRTARVRLGIKPCKRSFSGGWWWALPGTLPASTGDEVPT